MMRFVGGAVPEDPEFHPETDEWHGLREPDPVRMQFIALGPMIVVGALVFITIRYATDIDLGKALGWFLPAFFLMIPIHELIHAFASPSFGMSDKTFVGIWPSRLLFYAHYEGEIARERFLVVLAAPTVVLTLVPLLVITASSIDAPFLAAMAFANAIGAAGDIVGMAIVVMQIPRDAILRNKGWRTYWRDAVAAV